MMLFGGFNKITSLVLLLSLIRTSISSDPFAVDEFDESNEYRLPSNTKPTHYDVWLTVDVNKMKFSGTVKIIVESLEKSNFVALNVKDVRVDHTNVTLMDGENQIYTPLSVNNNVDTEIINFKFNHIMNVSSLYVLSVQFEGDIRNDTKGLYRSSYHHEGSTRYIATTFFAAAYARMILPCYDEPNQKAKFKINIIHNPKYHALSNMPIKSKSEQLPYEDGMILTKFEETPIMSTYLLAIIVSDLATLDTNTNNKISIYAPENLSNTTQYARDYSQKALDAIENYLDMKYQLPKLHLVAIDDFLMGAMENWGLITFKSTNLLYIEGKSPLKLLQQVTSAITHELLHMWFGNEVTCVWWSFVWLNEGFATFLENEIASNLFPEWRLMEQFTTKFLHVSLRKDDDVGVSAMTRPIKTPKEISEIYDFIVYPKAASIIRMIQHVMGPEIFRNSLHVYLSERSYNTAKPEHLFDAMESTLDEDSPIIEHLKPMLNSWTLTPGYPVITVKRTHDSVGTTLIHQERFLSTPDKTDHLYYIPLNYASQSHPNFANTQTTHWITENDTYVSVEIPESGWLIFNKQQFGYYRVNYDPKNWEMIISELNGRNYDKIHTLNRAQLIDDSFNLAKFGYLQISVALDLLKYLRQEIDLTPLRAAIEEIKFLEKVFAGHDQYDQLKTLLHNIFDEVYTKVKNSDTNEYMKLLTLIEVTDISCKLGVSACVTDAMQQFRNYEQIPVDTRQAVICAVVKESEKRVSEWNTLTNRLTYLGRTAEKRQENSVEFNDILSALTCATTDTKIESYLQMTIDKRSPIPWTPTDRNKIFELVLSSGYIGATAALNFLDNNFEAIVDVYDSMESLFSDLGMQVTTQELQNKLIEIKENHRYDFNENMEKAFDQTMEKADEQLEMSGKFSTDIQNWLNKEQTNNGVINRVSLMLSVFCCCVYL